MTALLGSDESVSGRFEPPLVNIGVGSDLTIAELRRNGGAASSASRADILYDRSKPDGSPRKLMDVSRLAAAGWTARTPLADGLRTVYAEFVRRSLADFGPAAQASEVRVLEVRLAAAQWCAGQAGHALAGSRQHGMASGIARLHVPARSRARSRRDESPLW